MDIEEIKEELRDWMDRKCVIDACERHKIAEPTIGGPFMVRSFRRGIGLIVLLSLVGSLRGNLLFAAPLDPIEVFRKSIFRFEDNEIRKWMIYEERNVLPPAASADRLRLKLVISPESRQEPPVQELIRKSIVLTEAWVHRPDFADAAQEFPGLRSSVAGDLLFLKGNYAQAAQMQFRTEQAILGEFLAKEKAHKGRHFNRDLAFQEVQHAMIITELYRAMDRRFYPSADVTAVAKESYTRIDCSTCTDLTMQYYLTLLLVTGDYDRFAFVIRRDMESGRSRSRLFLSKEVNSLYFDYFRRHSFWLTPDSYVLLDKIEKENAKKLPSCHLVNIFYECS
ncbi:MAG: hypothetical protein KDK33_09485 [Leptospiraceae bacterium]|nr:hypothetical protein [Leptospiraceae bacterium]